MGKCSRAVRARQTLLLSLILLLIAIPRPKSIFQVAPSGAISTLPRLLCQPHRSPGVVLVSVCMIHAQGRAVDPSHAGKALSPLSSLVLPSYHVCLSCCHCSGLQGNHQANLTGQLPPPSLPSVTYHCAVLTSAGSGWYYKGTALFPLPTHPPNPPMSHPSFGSPLEPRASLATWSGSHSSLALLPSTLAWPSGLQPHCLSVTLADTMFSLSSGLCTGCSLCLVCLSFCQPHPPLLISSSLTSAPAP